ncbi:MAG: DUF6588 family protein [Sphingobacteriales bacterium]
MKKIYSLSICVMLSVIAFDAAAQSSSTSAAFSALIQAGPADGSVLLKAYANPLFKEFGLGFNDGWNNTAKTKKLFHFDLRLSASASFVSNADKTFDVTKIGLSNHIGPADPNQTIAPTFAGETSTSGPSLNIYDNNGKKIGSFNTPSGQAAIIPVPQVQLTIGLIKNTDLTLRAIPSVPISNYGSISSYGFGLKHNIMQDFFGKKVKKLVPFDLAIAFGYSRLNLTTPLVVNPQSGAQPKDAQQSTDFSNQHIAGKLDNVMGQLIFSKKLASFTPFVAVAYNTTKTNVVSVGNYPVITGENLAFQPTYTTYTNPIIINENSVDGLRADIGFQLNLGFFRFYASGSLAEYKSVNAGIGFGF